MNLMEILLFIQLFIHLILLTVTVYNYFTAPRVKQKKPLLNPEPKISILIPARNEENNIDNCLNSVFKSDYKNYEVKVLDDFSIDSTKDKIKAFKRIYNNLELINGKDLPDGWTGKNWACNQLALKAGGEYLLFIDADVTISPDTIQSVLFKFQNKEVKMLSVFPSQKIRSTGEWLIVPLLDWLMLTFLPLFKVYKSSNPSFVAANGQFILFEKISYFDFGGHEKIKSKIVEDMEFARGFKKMKLKTITLLGNNFVNCRMYCSFNEALNGFTKNFYPGFNTNATVFSLIMIFFVFLFISPFVIIFYDFFAAIILVLIYLGRIITSSLSRQNLFNNIVLFLPQMFILIFTGFKSIYVNKMGRLIWKGRNL